MSTSHCKDCRDDQAWPTYCTLWMCCSRWITLFVFPWPVLVYEMIQAPAFPTGVTAYNSRQARRRGSISACSKPGRQLVHLWVALQHETEAKIVETKIAQNLSGWSQVELGCSHLKAKAGVELHPCNPGSTSKYDLQSFLLTPCASDSQHHTLPTMSHTREVANKASLREPHPAAGTSVLFASTFPLPIKTMFPGACHVQSQPALLRQGTTFLICCFVVF